MDAPDTELKPGDATLAGTDPKGSGAKGGEGSGPKLRYKGMSASALGMPSISSAPTDSPSCTTEAVQGMTHAFGG